MGKEQPFAQDGYDLMGAVFEVHRERGGGLAEEIYQECLEIELSLRGIAFRSKCELEGFYKGRKLAKRYIPDLFVMGCLVVELKAVSGLTTEHEGQLLNYMRLARRPVGYLVNFGPIARVEWRRFVLSEYLDEPPGNADEAAPISV